MVHGPAIRPAARRVPVSLSDPLATFLERPCDDHPPSQGPFVTCGSTLVFGGTRTPLGLCFFLGDHCAGLRRCGGPALLRSGRRGVTAAAAPERGRRPDGSHPKAAAACRHFGAQALGLAVSCASPVSRGISDRGNRGPQVLPCCPGGGAAVRPSSGQGLLWRAGAGWVLLAQGAGAAAAPAGPQCTVCCFSRSLRARLGVTVNWPWNLLAFTWGTPGGGPSDSHFSTLAPVGVPPGGVSRLETVLLLHGEGRCSRFRLAQRCPHWCPLGSLMGDRGRVLVRASGHRPRPLPTTSQTTLACASCWPASAEP